MSSDRLRKLDSTSGPKDAEHAHVGRQAGAEPTAVTTQPTSSRSFFLDVESYESYARPRGAQQHGLCRTDLGWQFRYTLVSDDGDAGTASVLGHQDTYLPTSPHLTYIVHTREPLGLVSGHGKQPALQATAERSRTEAHCRASMRCDAMPHAIVTRLRSGRRSRWGCCCCCCCTATKGTVLAGATHAFWWVVVV